MHHTWSETWFRKAGCWQRTTGRPISFLVFLYLLALTGCSGDPGTGPVEIKWDRDVCSRCNMVLSDRNHAAQIRFQNAGTRQTVWKFDDLGCALLWLDKQPWRDDPDAEIWVSEHAGGNWIDARTAHYVTGQLTPMEYGLGAQTEPTADTLSFAQARLHIEQIERRFNAHGTHLEQAAAARTLAPIATPTEQKP